MGPSHPEQPSRGHRSPIQIQREVIENGRRGTLPRFKVILLHDQGYDLMHVIRTVMELMRFCRAEATHKMWQAHHNGRSILLITWLERAELYVEQFAERGLQVATEPE